MCTERSGRELETAAALLSLPSCVGPSGLFGDTPLQTVAGDDAEHKQARANAPADGQQKRYKPYVLAEMGGTTCHDDSSSSETEEYGCVRASMSTYHDLWRNKASAMEDYSKMEVNDCPPNQPPGGPADGHQAANKKIYAERRPLAKLVQYCRMLRKGGVANFVTPRCKEESIHLAVPAGAHPLASKRAELCKAHNTKSLWMVRSANNPPHKIPVDVKGDQVDRPLLIVDDLYDPPVLDVSDYISPDRQSNIHIYDSTRKFVSAIATNAFTAEGEEYVKTAMQALEMAYGCHVRKDNTKSATWSPGKSFATGLRHSQQVINNFGLYEMIQRYALLKSDILVESECLNDLIFYATQVHFPKVAKKMKKDFRRLERKSQVPLRRKDYLDAETRSKLVPVLPKQADRYALRSTNPDAIEDEDGPWATALFLGFNLEIGPHRDHRDCSKFTSAGIFVGPYPDLPDLVRSKPRKNKQTSLRTASASLTDSSENTVAFAFASRFPKEVTACLAPPLDLADAVSEATSPTSAGGNRTVPPLSYFVNVTSGITTPLYSRMLIAFSAQSNYHGTTLIEKDAPPGMTLYSTVQTINNIWKGVVKKGFEPPARTAIRRERKLRRPKKKRGESESCEGINGLRVNRGHNGVAPVSVKAEKQDSEWDISTTKSEASMTGSTEHRDRYASIENSDKRGSEDTAFMAAHEMQQATCSKWALRDVSSSTTPTKLWKRACLGRDIAAEREMSHVEGFLAANVSWKRTPKRKAKHDANDRADDGADDCAWVTGVHSNAACGISADVVTTKRAIHTEDTMVARSSPASECTKKRKKSRESAKEFWNVTDGNHPAGTVVHEELGKFAEKRREHFQQGISSTAVKPRSYCKSAEKSTKTMDDGESGCGGQPELEEAGMRTPAVEGCAISAVQATELADHLSKKRLVAPFYRINGSTGAANVTAAHTLKKMKMSESTEKLWRGHAGNGSEAVVAQERLEKFGKEAGLTAQGIVPYAVYPNPQAFSTTKRKNIDDDGFCYGGKIRLIEAAKSGKSEWERPVASAVQIGDFRLRKYSKPKKSRETAAVRNALTFPTWRTGAETATAPTATIPRAAGINGRTCAAISPKFMKTPPLENGGMAHNFEAGSFGSNELPGDIVPIRHFDESRPQNPDEYYLPGEVFDSRKPGPKPSAWERENQRYMRNVRDRYRSNDRRFGAGRARPA